MKRFISSIFLLLLVVCATAQKEYYTSVDGVKGGAALKTALHELIKDHKKISYGSGEDKTWGAFYTTDAVVENGQRRVLDMYSAEKRYFGNKGSAVSGMNIEHSVAKSWWGGTENNAYCDIHHLNPSDQTANNRKSNYPLGELTSVSWDNGVTFVGKANIDGSSMNAYEPCDEYKGDFARVFMYMFTCYQDLTWEYTWMNYEKSTYPTLKPWAVKLLLKWHKQDPVSKKEVNRNNAVYAVQGNRNPYVDYPQLADYVWGDSINYVFHLTSEVEDGNDVNIYYGELVVGDYTQKSVSISVTETSDSTVDVFFDNVKFAAAMPLKIDITVKDVPSRKAGGVLSFSAVDIDPYMNREAEPQPRYRFASIAGAVEDGELCLEARMSDDLRPSYAGKSFSFNGTCSNNGDNSGGDDNEDNFTGGQFVLVTDAAQLTVGDSIVIGYENYVMGVHSDNGKYRTNTDMKTSGDVITYLADDAQIILLEEGVVDGTYAFNVGNGYLAASSSSSNNIATTTTLNENASWKIVINEGDAVITAQGDKTRNVLQYNTGSPRFSCYKDTQESVNIYAKSPAASGIDEVKGENGKVKAIYDLQGRRLNAITEPGIYIVDGKKILIK